MPLWQKFNCYQIIHQQLAIIFRAVGNGEAGEAMASPLLGSLA